MIDLKQNLDSYIDILIEVFEDEKENNIVDILKNSYVDLDIYNIHNYDYIDHYSWKMKIKTTTKNYKNIKQNLEIIENKIKEELKFIHKEHDDHYVDKVVIFPGKDSLQTKIIATEEDVRRIWGDKSKLKLFLSHKSEHKVNVSKLKTELENNNISAFVAHEDINPSQEWLNEIEKALNSMDALIVILTPDFKNSDWTNHEIGWGMGRGIPIITMSINNENPYGLFNKYQAKKSSFLDINKMSKDIIQIIMKQDSFSNYINKICIEKFKNSGNFNDAVYNYRDYIMPINNFTVDEKQQIIDICNSHYQILNANIHGILKGHTGKLVDVVKKHLGIQDNTDDEEIPF